jgi:hypothetical protein
MNKANKAKMCKEKELDEIRIELGIGAVGSRQVVVERVDPNPKCGIEYNRGQNMGQAIWQQLYGK